MINNLLKKCSYTKGAVLKPKFGKRISWQGFIDQEMRKWPKREREREREREINNRRLGETT